MVCKVSQSGMHMGQFTCTCALHLNQWEKGFCFVHFCFTDSFCGMDVPHKAKDECVKY